MSVRVALSHTTSYRYSRLARLSPQLIRLRPAPHNRTPIHSYSLHITPAEHFINWQQDPHGNYVARVVFPDPTVEFTIDVSVVADLAAYNPFDFFLEPDCEQFPFAYKETERKELAAYLECGETTPKLAALVASIDRTPRRTVDFLVEINQRIKDAVDYTVRMDPGVQTPEETLTLKSGSCRDSGWLLVQVLRRLGVAARFVSGYLIQLKPDQVPLSGPKGPTEDFTDLHAWTECFIPGAGWIGLDPTSGLFAAEGHIPLAACPEPASAAPLEGRSEKVETEFGFHMAVERVVDVPRVTKPYTEEQWKDIVGLGYRVDEHLVAHDIRLSMGGEPTFVSIKEPDAPEWNTEAMGGNKELIADRLLRKLWKLWAPGGVLHHGQGKWYPGEQLPRWAASCYYRKDGNPLWFDETLIARTDGNHSYTAADAQRFAQGLIRNLGLTRHGLMPAFEDALYYIWKERQLPSNLDVQDPRLNDPVERKRLRRIFAQGLDKTIGWVLPLEYWYGTWTSGDWFFTDEKCRLLPGDSPMGFRLPLDSLPWGAPSHIDRRDDTDPTAVTAPLPTVFRFPLVPSPLPAAPVRPTLQTSTKPGADAQAGSATESGREQRWIYPERARTAADPFARPAHYESAAGIVRTALCVEPRRGMLCVFLPPLPTAEAFVELVAAIEATAKELRTPVQLEGYPPPTDPRLGVFRVTPDPGVLEVNVPPVESWSGLVQQTHELYEAAREEDLGTEKFELDGAHVGSGGGNHLVLGSTHPLDSPFLRRPDLLASILAFWHNHPSLSYLFSGRFIGATSQAPRVDEGRDESLYELEIALGEIHNHSGSNRALPPWLIDRVLRHLLVDLTGNTHRTEFCIDKLYSPDGSTGRLGLLELRAFEMPPHERMANVQQLLVRSVIAAFWRRPYRQGLVRWGTKLHDRFLLPYFVKQDLADALSDLRSWGYDLSPEWFEPQYQFRFPYYGSVVKDAVRLELRGALEPWNVLGEEATQGGQARYVDSSLERLQVKVSGGLSERYAVCCNGVEVPLHPTGRQGEFVCGVKYRAWQPPSCLHPTIGVDSPLRFDLYDRWNQCAIAGATYHVVHPGGRANEVRPVNAVAAESRRIARFEPMGHHQRRYTPVSPAPNRDFPMTLDLRRVRHSGNIS